jgi:hypothetical protein
MNNEKLIEEIKKPQYKDLKLTNVYFNAIYNNITNNETNEEIIIKLIAMLCGNIQDVSNKLRKQKLQNIKESSGLFGSNHESISGLFSNKQKSLSGLFPDGKFMND